MRATSTYKPLLLAALLLSGCETIRYRLVPPPSENGRLCVTQCSGVREMCIGSEKQEAYYEREQCERRQEYDYYRCMDRGRGDADKQRKCDRLRYGCSAFADTNRCEHDYRACYVTCGGRVIEEIEKW